MGSPSRRSGAWAIARSMNGISITGTKHTMRSMQQRVQTIRLASRQVLAVPEPGADRQSTPVLGAMSRAILPIPLSL